MNKALLWLLVAVSPIRAGLILGSPPDPGTGNTFPFGSANFIASYEQVYNASAFTGTVTIDAIGFFHSQVPGGSFTGQTYTISLSTTSKPVNGLDLDNENANLGADNTLFATTSLSGVAPAGELLFTGTPFTYDPSLGNLLLTIDVSGSANYTVGDLYFDARDSTAAGQFSRAMYLAGGSKICCGNDNYGLTTDFRFAPVPEPASGLLLGSVFALWCGYRNRGLLSHGRDR